MRWVNQHSIVVVALALLGATVVAFRHFSRVVRLVSLLAVVAVLGTIAIVLRTGAGDIHGDTDLDRALADGQPVALEFYSNF